MLELYQIFRDYVKRSGTCEIAPLPNFQIPGKKAIFSVIRVLQ